MCSATRRQKELELQVLTGPVRNWQGQDLSTLGDIVHMGSVASNYSKNHTLFKPHFFNLFYLHPHRLQLAQTIGIDTLYCFRILYLS